MIMSTQPKNGIMDPFPLLLFRMLVCQSFGDEVFDFPMWLCSSMDPCMPVPLEP